ncbi:MAG: hypothetical protein IAX21_08335 [Candidatus Bathyarchaeota archaeon]|nr:MAG: hypothetical protein IAX21_08335 [Candidatus Bathyarchaeota archaeon]
MNIKQSSQSLVQQSFVNIHAAHLDESPLYFGKGAMDIDPRRGLSLYGPVDSGDQIQTIRVGIISNSKGIQDLTSCLECLNDNSVQNDGDKPFTTLSFPGFVTAFKSRIILSDRFNEKILSKEISRVVTPENPNTRIKLAAELYIKKVSTICDRVVVPDLIICHKIEEIEQSCEEHRTSGLTQDERKKAEALRKNIETHKLLAPPSKETLDFIDMSIRTDFRRTIKSAIAREQNLVPVQIIKQSTLESLNCAMKLPSIKRLNHKKQDPSTIAWNISVGLYYKSNHFPWRVGNLNQGTCYVGISFFIDQTSHERNMFASLAQIFTDTGEGLVVRGDSFKWNTKEKGSPQLSLASARNLLGNALELYEKHHNNQLPNRIVIHKSSKFIKEEIRGFLSASKDIPKYDYLSLSSARSVYFYRNGDNSVLRGTFIILPGNTCLVYTSGYSQYLKCYNGPRIPKPLEIVEHYGDTPLRNLALEILALTRLDWNTTRYSLSKPITLKFSERVGKILGALKDGEKIQHQYRFFM